LLGLDKKRRGDALKFVLVRAPGSLVIERLALTEVQRLARDLAAV
jgi:hypothetical protein